MLSWSPQVFVPPPRASALAILLAVVVTWPHSAGADRAVARALVEEGHRLLDAGASEAALNRFERAIAEDPDYLPAYDAATGLWLHGGQLTILIERLAQVTLRHPRYAAGWYALGVAYRRSERHSLAVLCYDTYLDLRPGDPDPYFGAAMSHIALGDRAQARAYLERFLELERRAERAEFMDRARLELARLREEELAAAPAALAMRLGRRIRTFASAAAALFD